MLLTHLQVYSKCSQCFACVRMCLTCWLGPQTFLPAPPMRSTAPLSGKSGITGAFTGLFKFLAALLLHGRCTHVASHLPACPSVPCPSCSPILCLPRPLCHAMPLLSCTLSHPPIHSHHVCPVHSCYGPPATHLCGIPCHDDHLTYVMSIYCI